MIWGVPLFLETPILSSHLRGQYIIPSSIHHSCITAPLYFTWRKLKYWEFIIFKSHSAQCHLRALLSTHIILADRTATYTAIKNPSQQKLGIDSYGLSKWIPHTYTYISDYDWKHKTYIYILYMMCPSSSAPTLFRPLSTPLKSLDIFKKQPFWGHSHVLLFFSLPLPPPSMVQREALGDSLAQPRLYLSRNRWLASLATTKIGFIFLF